MGDGGQRGPNRRRWRAESGLGAKFSAVRGLSRNLFVGHITQGICDVPYEQIWRKPAVDREQAAFILLVGVNYLPLSFMVGVGVGGSILAGIPRCSKAPMARSLHATISREKNCYSLIGHSEFPLHSGILDERILEFFLNSAQPSQPTRLITHHPEPPKSTWSREL